MEDHAIAELKAAWPDARIVRDDRHAARLSRSIFTACPPPCRPLGIRLTGSRFQLRIWLALMRVPPGGRVTYAELAAAAGHPGAARAAGNAVAVNPLAFLIPCHRVIPAAGGIGNYRWGAARKRIMLGREAAQAGRSLDLPETRPRGSMSAD
jgi:AraC family transcriptional regulator of adaptative response/methylated-DNA-[protein]-cysteine methyltransferase